MTTLQEALDPEARAFCEREGLVGALDTAIRLINEFFPEARDLRVELEWDPENPRDEWLAVTYLLPRGVLDLHERDTDMMDRWIADVPIREGGKVIMTFGVE